MQEAQAIINALKSENDSIKSVLEITNAQRDALKQTVQEILDANIYLKAGAALLEKRLQDSNANLKQKIDQIEKLESHINILEHNQKTEGSISQDNVTTLPGDEKNPVEVNLSPEYH